MPFHVVAVLLDPVFPISTGIVALMNRPDSFIGGLLSLFQRSVQPMGVLEARRSVVAKICCVGMVLFPFKVDDHRP